MTSNPDPEALRSLGAQVRQARGDRPQTVVAAAAKISFRTVDRIEKAQQVRPAPAELRRLLTALGLDVQEAFASLGYELWDEDGRVEQLTEERLSSLESRLLDVEARLAADEERIDRSMKSGELLEDDVSRTEAASKTRGAKAAPRAAQR